MAGCATVGVSKKKIVKKGKGKEALGYGYGEVYATGKKGTSLAARKKAAAKILEV
jgi:hypothetical protein